MLFLPVYSVVGAAGIPPLVLMAPLIIAAAPFWATYQNIWIAMGEGITAGQAFDAGQQLRLANVYALCSVIALVTAVGYWKLGSSWSRVGEKCGFRAPGDAMSGSVQRP